MNKVSANNRSGGRVPLGIVVDSLLLEKNKSESESRLVPQACNQHAISFSPLDSSCATTQHNITHTQDSFQLHTCASTINHPSPRRLPLGFQAFHHSSYSLLSSPPILSSFVVRDSATFLSLDLITGLISGCPVAPPIFSLQRSEHPGPSSLSANR